MTDRRNRGELESMVLRVLWDAARPLSARDVVSSLTGPDGAPALTTMLTVLDRLSKKGTVTKTPTGAGGVLFEAAAPESAYTADAMVTALTASSDRSAALMRFAGELDARDTDLLRRALGPEA